MCLKFNCFQSSEPDKPQHYSTIEISLSFLITLGLPTINFAQASYAVKVSKIPYSYDKQVQVNNVANSVASLIAQLVKKLPAMQETPV